MNRKKEYQNGGGKRGKKVKHLPANGFRHYDSVKDLLHRLEK